MATDHIRKQRQPARARQVEKSIRRSVVALREEPKPPSRVFKAKWSQIGTVLVCEDHCKLLGGVPVPDSRFDFVELYCFVCDAPLSNRPGEMAA